MYLHIYIYIDVCVQLNGIQKWHFVLIYSSRISGQHLLVDVKDGREL